MSNITVNADYEKFKTVFLDENSKINLISKNDEKFLYEKHFFDSLAIKLFFEKYGYTPEKLLDIGTGGGFPAVPVAMEYPQISVYGVDSIGKKIRAVTEIAEKLNLSNLTLINDRVENIKDIKFDLITSRAVGKIDLLLKYAYPLLAENGYIVLYKSKSANEEIDEAKNLIRRLHLKILPTIEYELPLEDKFIRNLVIFQK